MSGSSRTPPPADDLASLLQEHRPTSGILSRHPDDPLRNALAGAEGERHRYALAPFDAFDGVIHDPSAREHIARQFGHRHRFSPKQLNAMGACPFQFFAAYGLGLGPEEDKTDEADDLERGLAAHAILREFFTDARTHTGAATITSDRIDSARELLVRITERFFSRQIGLGLVGDPALWRAEQRTMLRHLISVLENEARMNAEDSQAGRTFTPMYLEYAYGRRGEPPLRWQDPSGDFEIAGRIDRIDVCTNSASGHLFRVWDYKLGSGHRAQDALTGTDFQLPIYVLAAQQNLFHGQGRCVTCGYYRVRRPVGPEGTASSEGRKASLDDILQAARTRIGALVRQIRAADFRVRPAQFDRCPRCDFRGICRVERFRAARKERPCPGTP
jgi:ATP-dependent helicase/DNAse subunit B